MIIRIAILKNTAGLPESGSPAAALGCCLPSYAKRGGFAEL